jgi:hypothetical protein
MIVEAVSAAIVDIFHENLPLSVSGQAPETGAAAYGCSDSP